MTSDLQVNIIVATDLNRGIGLNGTLPWKLPAETEYYHGMINHVSNPGAQNACLFGRVTYESIHDPRDYENLLKVVVSKQKRVATSSDKNLVFVSSFQEGIDYLTAEKERRNIETVWILGGAGIYAETLNSPYLHRIYLTRVLQKFECDTFFPEFDKSSYKTASDSRVPLGIQLDNSVKFQVEIYERN